ncbi:MAG: cytochrome c [Bacteroidetes bacterium]|nr:cytochrome c [Bacteroidota bacterium]
MKQLIAVLLIAALGLTSCKEESETTTPIVSAYDNADATKGGILYDKFWSSEAGYDVTDAAKISHLNKYADFYRCKQCHAWDQMGNEGSYNNRASKASTPTTAGRPKVAANLLPWLSKTPQQLFDEIKTGTGRRKIADSAAVTAYAVTTSPSTGDQMPDFSTFLTDAQIWDLVKFLKEGANDVTKLYDATYTGTYPSGKASFSAIGKDGDAVKGKTLYTTNCKSCHGLEGKDIPNLDATAGMTAGKFIRTKPNEAQHKIRFGQLGTIMKPTKLTVTELRDLYKALADTVAFPN